jgi:hypothetical protein
MFTPAGIWSLVNEWWPLLLGACALFVAMRLMRRTYRQANRREYDGIRWRGIQWQKPEEDDAPTDDEESK